ncbi:hypothetical protein RN001_010251 [Aquatica leii]|uniref:Coiled-coil domain-containing protein 167 n=1 Tax=Aquatica leii TaxID=1421715 RepID=A0AAN7Q340_9COLE|nr:hypothetical protein RN001_010251 [Aquatica leii]
MPIDNCSIMKEISKAEEEIKTCYARVSDLENKLNSDIISQQKRDIILHELNEVRKLLKINEENLSKLHGQNRRTFMLAFFLLLLCLIFFVFYQLITNF